jgi:hypothetical protein
VAGSVARRNYSEFSLRPAERRPEGNAPVALRISINGR